MFVMSYFRTQSEALHLALSDDGLTWTALNANKPVLHPGGGATRMRDPHLSRARDGLFHLLYTTDWSSDSIGHCTSPDLLHWNEQRMVPLMCDVAEVKNCWAPECFYDRDDGAYRVIWSSSVTERNAPDDWNHRIWSATTTNFIEYSAPELFFDPGYSIIDATIAYHNNEYLMAFKDERSDNRGTPVHKTIHLCKSMHGAGPWNEVSAPVTLPLTEGPALFRRNNEWVMLYDHFTEGFFGASKSADGVNWINITSQMRFPPGPRHASVVEVEPEIGEALRRLVPA